MKLPFDDALIVKVATGKSHSVILVDSGEVYGCGASNFGQLGSNYAYFMLYVAISCICLW
jgi:alpha-tubulin suppressor-like RCC1 family protein